MVIYQHPSTLWAALKRNDSKDTLSNPLMPTRIRIKNNGDGTGTARLVEAPTTRRPSFSLFNSSAKQGSKRKLSLSLRRFSNDPPKSLNPDDEGCHPQGSRSYSDFGKLSAPVTCMRALPAPCRSFNPTKPTTSFTQDIIKRLPTELATLVLQYCDLQSILAAQQVSRTWYKLTKQNQIWHSLLLQRPTWTIPTTSTDQIIDYADLYRRRTALVHRWRKGQVETRYLEGHQDSVYCLQFDSDKIVSGSRDKAIKVWDARSYECTQTLHGHTASVLCLRYNGNTLISGSSDTTVRVWDLDTSECIMQLNGHSSGVLDVCFNEQYIISCSKDTTIRVWDRTTGNHVATLNGHRGPVNSVQVCGQQLVSAAGDGLVKLWDLDTLELKRDFAGHTRGLACVQFDGNRILSGSNDKKIKVWDAHTGECTMTLEGHEDLVRTLSFNEVECCRRPPPY